MSRIRPPDLTIQRLNDLRFHIMKPLVSILIPAYNAEPWIADIIKSALNQTWPSKEIIIVDDGSCDQTLRVARQFASKAVSVVTQENQGASAARNNAFELCPDLTVSKHACSDRRLMHSDFVFSGRGVALHGLTYQSSES
jgi:glycosyltransferase involved in cell wall biosynthesis